MIVWLISAFVAAPFSYELLSEKAAALSAKPYVAPVAKAPKVLESLDYDRHQKIKFKKEAAIGRKEGWQYPVELFHPGRFFQNGVDIYRTSGNKAEPFRFDKKSFTYEDKNVEKAIPPDVGYAGLRFSTKTEPSNDWLVFLGASYFRSSMPFNQYGMSARGIAVDTGLNKPEEFPRFSELYVEEGLVHALLDGPSITGAYRFKLDRNDALHVTVDACLFLRKPVERLGIAPLTSMYWFSETHREHAIDWRPEVHDSDGLAMWTGAGERIFRPLGNPPRVDTSSFLDAAPKGFGLVQRDRNFASYEDDGVFYDKRPTVWIEPQKGFEKGAVQLVEIPTDDEIFDNIVAYWLPEPLPKAGEKRCFTYVQHWQASEPAANVGRVVATRSGRGGVPGQPRPPGLKKFAIDFEGGPLEQRIKADKVEPVIAIEGGTLVHSYALQVVGTKKWRAVFDIKASSSAPVLLRAFLRYKGEAQSETWLYTYHPPMVPRAP
jgi:glucans biosynthesis protein